MFDIIHHFQTVRISFILLRLITFLFCKPEIVQLSSLTTTLLLTCWTKYIVILNVKQNRQCWYLEHFYDVVAVIYWIRIAMHSVKILLLIITNCYQRRILVPVLLNFSLSSLLKKHRFDSTLLHFLEYLRHSLLFFLSRTSNFLFLTRYFFLFFIFLFFYFFIS